MSRIQLDLIEIATTLRGDVPEQLRTQAREYYWALTRADFDKVGCSQFLERIKREYGMLK